MFLGLEWYWWLIIVGIVILSVPLKVRFIKWWDRRRQEQKQNAKWGGGE